MVDKAIESTTSALIDLHVDLDLDVDDDDDFFGEGDDDTANGSSLLLSPRDAEAFPASGGMRTNRAMGGGPSRGGGMGARGASFTTTLGFEGVRKIHC